MVAVWSLLGLHSVVVGLLWHWVVVFNMVHGWGIWWWWWWWGDVAGGLVGLWHVGMSEELDYSWGFTGVMGIGVWYSGHCATICVWGWWHWMHRRIFGAEIFKKYCKSIPTIIKISFASFFSEKCTKYQTGIQPTSLFGQILWISFPSFQDLVERTTEKISWK